MQNWQKQHKKCTKCVKTLCLNQKQRWGISLLPPFASGDHIMSIPTSAHPPTILWLFGPFLIWPVLPRPPDSVQSQVPEVWVENTEQKKTGGDIFSHVTCESLMALNAQETLGEFRMLHGANTFKCKKFWRTWVCQLAQVLEPCRISSFCILQVILLFFYENAAMRCRTSWYASLWGCF